MHPVLFSTLAMMSSVWMVRGEFFTAMAEMEKLLHTEEEIVKTLDLYLRKEEERLEKVKWLSKQFSSLNSSANGDADQFLANPVNAYLLVKRLTADWEEATQLITSFENQEVFTNISTQDLHFPSTLDLSGAAAAVIRLQETYLLDTKALANGRITETIESAAKLTAGDCFELGQQAFLTSHFNISIAWMQEALDILEDEESKTADEAHIYDHLAYAYYMVKNYTAPIIYTEKILSIDPDNPRAKNNIRLYRQKKLKEEAKKKGDHEPEQVTKPDPEYPEGYLHPSITEAYEKLCRGESTKSQENLSKLYCYYTSNNNSYLLLQPVKVEILSLNPRFVVFHDVINEKEVSLIKTMAIPKLARATVSNGTTGEQQHANYRISKSSWLDDYEHPIVSRLSQRVEDITGLRTKSSEALHVINYGIGGHYESHFDFASPSDQSAFPEEIGNRLATWIFYLSEVSAGGSTVFPTMGVEVKPLKGSAAFWYNLHRNGEGDTETRHAACPVLSGSKWVANKWIHEVGNEFRRPCGLHRDE